MPLRLTCWPELNCFPALAQLERLKKGNERINADAREAIKWLDDITSIPDILDSGRVQLEGTDDVFPTWEEAEKFKLPETLLSMEDSESDEDEYHEDLESSFNALDVSDGTSISSAHSHEDPPKTPQSPESAFSVGHSKFDKVIPENAKAAALLESPDRHARNSAEASRADKSSRSVVPTYLQPLFNHILWRIHREANPDAALASFILLTNDPAKQSIAQKFGIRAKRLEQLRDAVAREDREYKNHLTMYKIESEAYAAKAKPSNEQKPAERPKSSHSSRSKTEVESDEDVVLLNRAPRGPQAQATNGQRVLDPNDFGRTTQTQSPRGGRGAPTGPRGRGTPSRGGRGGFVPRGAYVPPAAPFRNPPAARHDPDQPIDPDSFARPAPRPSPMRGARRKLWEPN